MNFISTTGLAGKETVEDKRRPRCGGQRTRVNSILASAGGRVIRMFERRCGEKNWTSDPACPGSGQLLCRFVYCNYLLGGASR
jgi:hypothetical protein